jgi:hypothetical protein
MPLRSLILAFALAAASHAANPINPADLPPMPPPGPSPLQQFRAWLGMPEADREKALAQYPPDKQKVLREKILAYSILPRAQLDRRLNMLELRWHLRPLMPLPPAERAERLALVPPPIQPMVLVRLEAWDKLPEQTQTELLATEEAREMVMAHFAQIRRGFSQEQIFRSLDPERRERLEHALELWNRTAAPDRQRMAAQISYFFELAPEERSRTLARLSPTEQADVQRTLDAFAKLPPEQRRACVRSFEKFARMSQEERVSFLRNAARWQAMTPKERETWKDIVTKLPPMPPEPETLPPLPPDMSAPRKVATNAAP